MFKKVPKIYKDPPIVEYKFSLKDYYLFNPNGLVYYCIKKDSIPYYNTSLYKESINLGKYNDFAKKKDRDIFIVNVKGYYGL